MSMERYALIMAGGSGERFFPLSRQSRPKQLLPLLGDGKTLLEHTIDRTSTVVSPDHIIIITSQALQQAISESVGALIPPSNIIAEPAKRNTAGCLTFGTALLRARGINNAIVAALPADAYINDTELFAAQLHMAFEYAHNHDAIVTFGIPPAYPSTGFGYIELGMQLDGNMFCAARFREKPDRASAEEFMRTGKFLWNSGIFVYRQEFFDRQLKKYAPTYGNAIEPIARALQANDSSTYTVLFEQLPNLSIDYALMEHSQGIVVIKAAFEWDDLGSWDALARIFPSDDQGNVLLGTSTVLDTHTSIMANYSSRPMLLCALGIRDIVAVVTDDVIMLCHTEQVQQVRRLVEHLRNSDWNTWL